MTEIKIAVIIPTTWHSLPLLKAGTSTAHFSANFYSFGKFSGRLLPFESGCGLHKL